jgi:hypothetical protein
MTKSHPTPTPTTEPKTRSAASLAATAFNRTLAIDVEERAELQQSPATIKAKHEARRKKVADGLPADARALLVGMLNAARQAKAAEPAGE